MHTILSHEPCAASSHFPLIKFLKKEIILVYIELTVGIYLEIGRPCSNILGKIRIKKVMKHIRKRKEGENERIKNRKTLIENRKKTYLGRKIYLGI